jgi:hypothetical protein
MNSLRRQRAPRFVAGRVEPRTAATESRLAVVIQQLVRLAEETDANPPTRIAALLAERERIDREIERIRQGRLEMLPDASALERIREIIALADDLAGDFRRVRDRLEHLNRDLRERLVDSDTARGEVLEALFTGVDLIAESEAGMPTLLTLRAGKVLVSMVVAGTAEGGALSMLQRHWRSLRWKPL